jgi:hypothetical protein
MTEIRADVLEWLLGEDNPSVRYYAFHDLLDRPAGDSEMESARKGVMLTGVVPQIISKITADEYRPLRQDFYSKYQGLSWQILILAELGAERTGPVKDACECLISNSQDKDGGGFSVRVSGKTGGGLPSMVIPCLTGNMIFSLIRLGYIDDPRVAKAIEWMAKYQRFDDAEGDAPKGPPYDRMVMCWGKHSCHMGVVKVLKALAEIPPARRTAEVAHAIDCGVEYMLKHHIHKRSHDLSKVSKPGWLKFGFPLMYQTDVLEILEILLKLGVRDSRMQEALDVVASKQDAAGKWSLENNHRNDLLVDVEQNGPSKWITLRALRVLTSN